MRAILAALTFCVFTSLFAAPASAHPYRHHRVHPMVQAPGLGFAHMMASMRTVKHLDHARHHVAGRPSGHRHAEYRMRKFAQPHIEAAFLPFEPGAPFSFAFGAAQDAVDAGVAAIGIGSSVAADVAVGAAAGVYGGASAVIEQVRQAARAAGVPESIALAVARFESRFNENERGRAGEIGDMQVLPRTARAMGCSDLRNHSCVRAAGMRYLALALQQPGSMCEKLSAYNHGLGYRACTSYGRNIQRLAGLR